MPWAGLVSETGPAITASGGGRCTGNGTRGQIRGGLLTRPPFLVVSSEFTAGGLPLPGALLLAAPPPPPFTQVASPFLGPYY
jgi:hypothetical protein